MPITSTLFACSSTCARAVHNCPITATELPNVTSVVLVKSLQGILAKYALYLYNAFPAAIAQQRVWIEMLSVCANIIQVLHIDIFIL